MCSAPCVVGACTVVERLRRRLLAALAFTPALALGGCTRAAPLRLGLHPWIGYDSLPIAEALGWLPPEVTLHSGAAASDSLAGLRAGTLDAACVTLDEVLQLRAAGVSMTLVAVMDISAGADVLLTRAEVGDLTELAGRRLALEFSALGELMLVEVLERAGLSREQVRLVNLPPDQHLGAWQAGRIDASICYEPVASRLQRLGAVRRFDSREAPELIFDVLAVRSERLAPCAEALRGALMAHFRGLDHLRENRQDALLRIATLHRMHHDEVREALAGLVFPSLRANYNYLQPQSRLYRVAEHLNAILLQHQVIAKAAPLDGLCSAAYLPQEG